MKLISWFKQQLCGNALDELQQQKADQIGHRGYWLAWWLLLAALLGQSIAGAEMPQMAGEWVIFMVLNFYGLIEWLRNGIWTISDARPTFGKTRSGPPWRASAFSSTCGRATAARTGGSPATGGARPWAA